MMSMQPLIRTGRILALLLAGLYASLSPAGADIHVVALFKGRVMVVIDGKRQLLRTGETSPEGVKLVSADSAGAVFEYRGKTLRRQLDGRVQTALTAPEAGAEVLIFRDTRGMFHTVGSIDGMPVKFLVDTGASSIAMNSSQARRLGIDFLVDGDPTQVTTASDVVTAYRLKLDVVKVGSIQLRNVLAVVIDGPQPADVLLGMSFLGRLEMINQGDKLILRRKY